MPMAGGYQGVAKVQSLVICASPAPLHTIPSIEEEDNNIGTWEKSKPNQSESLDMGKARVVRVFPVSDQAACADWSSLAHINDLLQ